MTNIIRPWYTARSRNGGKLYPYVARASKSFASTMQLLIDRYKDRSKLMLILCGSSMSYMEDHVLAYMAPLYGRRTAQII